MPYSKYERVVRVPNYTSFLKSREFLKYIYTDEDMQVNIEGGFYCVHIMSNIDHKIVMDIELGYKIKIVTSILKLVVQISETKIGDFHR